MIVDFDDFHEDNHREDLLLRLKEINPAFKVTLFAVPGLGRLSFWDKWSKKDWVELAVHGWFHPSPYECAHWDKNKMYDLTLDKFVQNFFVDGFKAPGWQISNDIYEVLLDLEWWVADQHLEDHRRPSGLRTYFYEDSDDRWHGHIQNVCGNGLEERWNELVERVAKADSFQFCSEALSFSPHAHDQRKREVPA